MPAPAGAVTPQDKLDNHPRINFSLTTTTTGRATARPVVGPAHIDKRQCQFWACVHPIQMESIASSDFRKRSVNATPLTEDIPLQEIGNGSPGRTRPPTPVDRSDSTYRVVRHQRLWHRIGDKLPAQISRRYVGNACCNWNLLADGKLTLKTRYVSGSILADYMEADDSASQRHFRR